MFEMYQDHKMTSSKLGNGMFFFLMFSYIVETYYLPLQIGLSWQLATGHSGHQHVARREDS